VLLAKEMMDANTLHAGGKIVRPHLKQNQRRNLLLKRKRGNLLFTLKRNKKKFMENFKKNSLLVISIM